MYFFLSLIVMAVVLWIYYLIIKAALKDTISKDIQRTNELLMELLKVHNIKVGDIETKEEKLKRIVDQQIKLNNRLDRKEIDTAEYSEEYAKLEEEKRWVK